jgi:sec-independent protein translocase protein TatC
MESIDKFLPHLIELRKRLLHCVGFYVLLLVPLFYFSAELYTLVAQPILKTLPQGGMLVATKVISPFTTPFKLSMFVSFVILVPYILYHIWAFVAPGLYSHEKRTIKPILIYSIILFYTGILFAHFLVLPMALGFFMHIAPKGITVMTDITHYLDFVLAIYMAFGISFQVPIVTFILIQTGIVSIETFEKNRAYIIVAAFVLGMILTPPDVISQIMLAVPLLGLFESGLFLAKWNRRSILKNAVLAPPSPESTRQ